MWVVLKGGHVVAIARDQMDDSQIAVRCWNEEDARYVLAQMPEYVDKSTALVGPTLSDYPWRVVCSTNAVKWFIDGELYKVDYEKFKPTVDMDAAGGRARHDALLAMFFAGWDHLRDTPYTGGGKRNYTLHRKLGKNVKVRVESWLERGVEKWAGWTEEEKEWL